MRTRTAALLALLLLSGVASADEAAGIEAPAGRAGYSLGFQIGGDLAREGRAIDADALLRGLQDGLQGRAPALPPEQMNAILVELKERITASVGGDPQRSAEQRRREGAEFLAANEKRKGVVSLPSGLQYTVLREGSGGRPGPSDRVKVRYRSTLIDGTEFHDTEKRYDGPETIHVSGVIRGLTEALQLMPAGARWRVFIPPDLAFGRRGPLADRTVIYEIELVSIEAGD